MQDSKPLARMLANLQQRIESGDDEIGAIKKFNQFFEKKDYFIEINNNIEILTREMEAMNRAMALFIKAQSTSADEANEKSKQYAELLENVKGGNGREIRKMIASLEGFAKDMNSTVNKLNDSFSVSLQKAMEFGEKAEKQPASKPKADNWLFKVKRDKNGLLDSVTATTTAKAK